MNWVLWILSESLSFSFFIRRRIGNVIRLNNIVNEQEALLREQAQEIRELNSSIIETLSTAIEFRDCESGSMLPESGI